MKDDQPYEKAPWFRYFEVEVSKGVFARFKKHILTRATYVFSFNCKPHGNRWNETGYGWGVWERI